MPFIFSLLHHVWENRRSTWIRPFPIQVTDPVTKETENGTTISSLLILPVPLSNLSPLNRCIPVLRRQKLASATQYISTIQGTVRHYFILFHSSATTREGFGFHYNFLPFCSRSLANLFQFLPTINFKSPSISSIYTSNFPFDLSRLLFWNGFQFKIFFIISNGSIVLIWVNYPSISRLMKLWSLQCLWSASTHGLSSFWK